LPKKKKKKKKKWWRKKVECIAGGIYINTY